MDTKIQSPEQPQIQPALVNITSLARLLGIGRTTAYEWLYSEQLPPAAKVINRRRYWTKSQVETFLKGIEK
ncbi:MAG: helix-turn-helix domain-containing protein [Planctomycetota bacterium]